MKKRILFINPALPDRNVDHPINYLDTIIANERDMIEQSVFKQYIWPKYKALGIEKTFRHYSKYTASLGLLSLAAVLRKNGHEVGYVQIRSDGSNLGDIIEQAAHYHIVGATAICTTIQQALDILSGIKAKYAHKITTILGGPHISHLKWNEIGNMDGIDMLVRGEGEIAINKIASDPTSTDQLNTIEGLEFRNGEQIIKTTDLTRISEQALQKLPVPAYDLIPEPESTQFYIENARGCNHNCFFCSEHPKIRYFTTRQIETNLLTLEKYRSKNLIFVIDNNFISSDAFLHHFEKAVKQSGITNYFYVQTRIESVNMATLKRLYNSHVINYFFGIENTSDQVLKTSNKRITWDDILKGLQAAYDFYTETGYEVPPYRANFIQGLPGEDSVQSLLNMKRRRYLLDNRLITVVHDNIFQPTPGSLFYKNPDKYGLKIPAGYRTSIRWAMPEYEVKAPGMSRISLFLYHLQMRQAVNDVLISRFGLEKIRKQAQSADRKISCNLLLSSDC